MFFWTLKHVAKQAKTLLCIDGVKIHIVGGQQAYRVDLFKFRR